MKITAGDLKKALKWIESNSNDVMINVASYEPGKLTLSCKDKYESFVTITIFEDGLMMPKIQKEDIL